MRSGTQIALVVLVIGASLAAGFGVRRFQRGSQRPHLLVRAALKGDLAKLEAALDAGVDPDAIPTPESGAPQLTALEAAASHGHVDAVQMLLEFQAKPQPLLTNGWEVVDDAAWQAQRSVTELLLAAGANPDEQNEHGNTAVHNAVLLSARDVLELLLDRGASADIPNSAGLTPAHLALKLDEPEFVRLIAKHQQKPDVFVAVAIGDIDALMSLLPGRPDWVNVSPPPLADYGLLHLAARYGESAVAEYLIRLAADVNNAEESSGRVALHWAAERGRLEIVGLLLDAKADVEAAAGDRTPIDFASLAGHADIVETLLRAGAKPNPNLIPVIEQLPTSRRTEGHARVIELLRE